MEESIELDKSVELDNIVESESLVESSNVDDDQDYYRKVKNIAIGYVVGVLKLTAFIITIISMINSTNGKTMFIFSLLSSLVMAGVGVGVFCKAAFSKKQRVYECDDCCTGSVPLLPLLISPLLAVIIIDIMLVVKNPNYFVIINITFTAVSSLLLVLYSIINIKKVEK